MGALQHGGLSLLEQDEMWCLATAFPLPNTTNLSHHNADKHFIQFCHKHPWRIFNLDILIKIIQYISNILTLLVIVDIFVGYFLSPFHPVRRFLDSIVRPMLEPIRRFMPQTGMLDFSPLVLVILIQLVELGIIWLIGTFI
jgi:YggT family protein